MKARPTLAARLSGLSPALLLALLAAGAAADDPSAALRERLAAASAERGAQAFDTCAACHSDRRGDEALIGPNLWGIVDRAVAGETGFEYSDALLAAGGTWTLERLDALIENPTRALPGNTMGFYGIRDPQERADILAHLLTLRDDEAGEEDEEGGSETGEGD
jgi:cytochrome c